MPPYLRDPKVNICTMTLCEIIPCKLLGTLPPHSRLQVFPHIITVRGEAIIVCNNFFLLVSCRHCYYKKFAKRFKVRFHIITNFFITNSKDLRLICDFRNAEKNLESLYIIINLYYLILLIFILASRFAEPGSLKLNIH